MTELPRYQNFINGQPMANASGETFPVVNPATGEVIYEMEIADEAVQKAAIDSAQDGFKVWSAMTGAQRGRILQRAVALLRERSALFFGSHFLSLAFASVNRVSLARFFHWCGSLAAS